MGLASNPQLRVEFRQLIVPLEFDSSQSNGVPTEMPWGSSVCNQAKFSLLNRHIWMWDVFGGLERGNMSSAQLKHVNSDSSGEISGISRWEYILFYFFE